MGWSSTSSEVPAPGRSRPRGRGLSVDRIISATLRLIDDQGMAAASMRGVAAALQVEPMSLYSHVGGRDDLLDRVVERIVDELSDDPDVRLEPGEDWRAYMASMARGVRRYALAHPHAFPLVATRPSQAPWVNPPLRSLRWIENFLATLRSKGFTDEQVLFAYRSFNSFLLGYLLLETSAIALRDPLPGDGSFTSGSPGRQAEGSESGDGSREPANASDPVPGALSPTRSRGERRALHEAQRSEEPERIIDPTGEVDPQRYPTVHQLAEGLAEDTFEREFDVALGGMLDRIAGFVENRRRG